MGGYFNMMALMHFLVNYLLLLGTNRLCGDPPGWGRSALAAVLGGTYGVCCVVPRLYFLSNTLWRLTILGIVGWVAFGFSKSAARRTVIFIFLCMAMGGVAQGLGSGGKSGVIASAVVVFGMCMVGFRERPGSVRYVPVELLYGDKKLHLTALCDTGNTLRDPITGRPVLVVGAEIAQQLVGLTEQQLRSPVRVVGESPVPGLRLIPYRTVGQSTGMLLALRISQVRIGTWKGSSLVAFAPEQLSGDGRYQALTGGAA